MSVPDPNRIVINAALAVAAAMLVLWLVIRGPTPPPTAAPAAGTGVPAGIDASNRILLLESAPYLVLDPTSLQVQKKL